MSYLAHISVDTVEMQDGLKDMRLALSRTSWYLRVLGLPPEQRQALTQMLGFIRTLYTLQMLLSATTMTGALRKGAMLMRVAGLGVGATGIVGGLRVLNDVGRVTG
jgi:hypothetical protein